MKICTKCKEDKEFSEFGKAKLGKEGLRAICKKCHSEANSKWAADRKEHVAYYGKKYRELNKQEICIKRADYAIKNKDKKSKYEKEWRKNNPGKANAKTAKRRNSKRKATPKWLTKEHWEQIEKFYIEAAKITRESGIPHEVDHIVPIRGINVCGLHVPWNLRVITRSENRKKSRKF